MEEITPKILIGVPILAWSHDFAMSFLNFWTDLMTYQHKGRSFQVCYDFKYRRPVHLAEEELAQDALDAGCTHLLLMDDDIYDVTAQDMLKLLDADKDVIGGIMFTSKFPHAMCAFRRYAQDTTVAEQPTLKSSLRLYEIPGEQRVGIQPVDLIPFGFTLIKTDVFSRIPKPWFKCNTDAPTDSWFADSVLDANLQYFCHFDVWLNHNGVSRFNHHLHMQLGMAAAQQKGRVIGISPEEMARHEAMMRIKMQQAEDEFKQKRISDLKFFERKEGTEIGVPIIVEEKKNV